MANPNFTLEEPFWYSTIHREDLEKRIGTVLTDKEWDKVVDYLSKQVDRNALINSALNFLTNMRTNHEQK